MPFPPEFFLIENFSNTTGNLVSNISGSVNLLFVILLCTPDVPLYNFPFARIPAPVPPHIVS